MNAILKSGWLPAFFVFLKDIVQRTIHNSVNWQGL